MRKSFFFIILFMVFIQVSFYRCSSDSKNGSVDLASLSLSAGILQPAFDSFITEYSIRTGTSTGNTTVVAEGVSDSSTIIIRKNTVSYNLTDSIVLDTGDNSIEIEVAAKGSEDKKTYTININRASATAAGDANLSNLDVSLAVLNESFNESITSYTVDVENDVSSIAVTPVLNDSNAFVTVDALPVASGDSSGVISLMPGNNTISIIVTAENNVTQKLYSIIATREIVDFYSEGAIENPFEPVLNEGSYLGMIGDKTGPDSYYKINVSEGHYYSITLSELSQDADLYVYSDNDFSQLLDSSDNIGLADESITVFTTGIEALYILIDSNYVNEPGTSFTLSISDLGAPLTSEGSPAAPVDLGSLDVNYSGQVGDAIRGDSYYMVDVTDGHSYTISLEGLSENADLYVYEDSSFSSLLDSSINSTGREEIIIAASGISKVYILVDSSNVAFPGTEFLLNIISHGTTPRYYITTFDNASSCYSALDSYIYLYENDGSTLIDSADFGGPLSFSELQVFLSSGVYYLKVRSFFTAQAGRYSLVVDTVKHDGAPSSGTPGCPDAFEDGDDVYTGGYSLTIGTPVDRTLEAGDEDWFEITIP